MEKPNFDLLNGQIPETKNDHLNSDHLDTASLIQGYILNCHCEGKSPKTIGFYEGNLRRFLRYCRENNYPTNPAALTPLYIRQFLWYVTSEPVRWGINSSRSIRPAKKAVWHYYHCLHIFFEWLKREEVVRDNPLDRISKPKKEKKSIQALSAAEIKTLLDNCPVKSITGYRTLITGNEQMVALTNRFAT